MSITLISSHNFGFFSCCSIKLHDIVNYINANKKTPDYVDSSSHFGLYKPECLHDYDITYHYFLHPDASNAKINPNNNIHYNHTNQYINYSKLDYCNLNPLIEKYFVPSNEINNIIQNIENKYNLVYCNICVLFYRGNDKITETQLCSYSEYLNYAEIILKENPDTKFLIQSDETEFLEFMTNKFPNNSFYFNDEIRHINKSNTTVEYIMKESNYIFSKYYLAITIIMSKCKYVVCGSGNCSIWIMLYRKSFHNVFQYLNGQWFVNMTMLN
jgi:hypothetical protein